MFAGLGLFVTPDTWLALVSGRLVAGGGPPFTDTLTSWTLGRHWIDQQWLGQAGLYEIWRLGGLVLVGLVHGLTVVATFIATLVVARRRGGAPREVAIVGLLALLPIGLVAGNIRTQTFALPLFVLVLWLVCTDDRAPSRRVYWCFPLLVLWANVHGSVIVGGGLVALAGAIAIVRGVRDRTTAQVRHGCALLAMVPIAALGTPYGVSLLTYFRDTFGNTEIPKIASDWMPTVLEPVNVPFYLLAGLTLALIGRARRQLTAFEKAALLLLLVGALAAGRNLAWFALAAVMLLPPLLTGLRPGPQGSPPPVWLAATVSAVTIVGVLAATVHGLRGVDRQVESRFPSGAVAAVARVADRDPGLRLFSDARYSDWLLFRHPRLAGRIPLDIRFELFDPEQLRRFRRFRDQLGDGWRSSIGGARLVVLDRSKKPLGALPSTSEVLLREPGARQSYADGDLVVVLLPRHRAAAG